MLETKYTMSTCFVTIPLCTININSKVKDLVRVVSYTTTTTMTITTITSTTLLGE